MREFSRIKAILPLICITFVITEAFVPQKISLTKRRVKYYQPNSYDQVEINAPISRNCLFLSQKYLFQTFNNKKQHKTDITAYPRKLSNHNLLSSLSDDNEAGSNQKSLSSKYSTIFLSVSLCLTIFYCKPELIFGLIPKIQFILLGLKDRVITSLDYLNGLGNVGLIAYFFLLLLWEATVGVTTPLETCAGMAFGVKRGILANAIGKISGALVAFMIGRFFLHDYVKKKLEQKDSDGNSTNEMFNLIESSFESNPIGVALIWRFSPLPEFLKNFGLSAIPGLKLRHFFVAVLLHGFPFTCLWTVLGAETSMVLRGLVSEPSKILKIITSLVPPFGFIVSPTLVGLWIKSLKKKQVQSHEEKAKDCT